MIQIIKGEEGLKAGWTMQQEPRPRKGGVSPSSPPPSLPFSQSLPSPCFLAPCPQRKLLDSLLQAPAVVSLQKREDSRQWSSPTVRGGRWTALEQQPTTEMTQTLEPSWLGRPSERLLTSMCLKLSSIRRDTNCSFTWCHQVWTRQGLIISRALHTVSTH